MGIKTLAVTEIQSPMLHNISQLCCENAPV